MNDQGRVNAWREKVTYCIQHPGSGCSVFGTDKEKVVDVLYTGGASTVG